MGKALFSWELVANNLVIDVRSEIEFAEGHIPGAINIPILNTEERRIVGKTYKDLGKKKAILKGLELSGPHLHKRLKWAVKLADKHEHIIIHCWRGGMRSAFFSYLMEFFGINVTVLVGGYKSYRQKVRATFELPYSFKILGGMTGSGKTHIIKELNSQNTKSIDLEGIANHRGSSYGALGMQKQPSQEQFENNLAQELIHVGDKPTWLEDESRSIGARIIPEGIWNQMREAPHYFLDKSFDERLEQIMLDYGHFSLEELIICTQRIAKRLGPQHAKKAVEHLNNNDIKSAFAISLKYYDKTYTYNKNINPLGEKIKIECSETNFSKIADYLVYCINGK